MFYRPQMTDRSYYDLGKFHRKATTTSSLAQQHFDDGLAFLYAFNHDEAIRSFQKAFMSDESFAMAYWGIATANGPHINNPTVDAKKAKAAWQAANQAKRYASNGTPQEKALIETLFARFVQKQPLDRSQLDRNYALEMQAVWKKFPKDPDIGALYAEAMMDLRPWDLWKSNGSPQPGTPEIVNVLERVLSFSPDHPLANHLYIHAMEASPNPEKANRAADTLRDLQPGLGHMVHMPSHIDVRQGRWKAAVIANEKSIRADLDYAHQQPEQGFYRLYMTHNYHMLAFAAMMRGQSKLAISTMDEGVANIPAKWASANVGIIDGFMAMPIEVRVRFGKWEDVLKANKPSGEFALAGAMWHMARGIAFASTKQTADARMELSRFRSAVKKVPSDRYFGNNTASALLTVALHMLEGEILIAEGHLSTGIKTLQNAVIAEDQLRYDEPPDWIIPTRHALGAAQMRAGKWRAAEKTYKADLDKLPMNGWSLYGLSQSLERQGKKTESQLQHQKFMAVWSESDVQIKSSCLCLPFDTAKE